MRLLCTRDRAATAVGGLLDAGEQDHTVILAADEVERAVRALEQAATVRTRIDWTHDTLATVLDGRGQLTDAINELVQHGLALHLMEHSRYPASVRQRGLRVRPGAVEVDVTATITDLPTWSQVRGLSPADLRRRSANVLCHLLGCERAVLHRLDVPLTAVHIDRDMTPAPRQDPSGTGPDLWEAFAERHGVKKDA